MGLLVTLLVLVVVLMLAFWLVGMLPGDPKLKQIAQVIVVVIGLIYLLAVLFGRAPVVPWG